MAAKLERICTICARGGSKGVPNKNIRLLQGKPLIAHSITQAQESKLFSKIAVSSDSDQILEIANQAKVDYTIKRPENLANDQAAKLPAIRHCVEEAEKLSKQNFSTFVDLDATSPLRKVEDIIEAVELIEKSDSDNLLSGTPSHRSPYFNMVEFDQDNSLKLVKPLENKLNRRQDPDTLLYVMPGERSRDIDSELDFKIVEFLADNNKN